MNKLKTLRLASLSLAVSMALALPAQTFAQSSDVTISEIQIRGLNRVSKGAVLLALPVKEGDLLTKENVALSMRQLYATGDFDEVKLSRDGQKFIVTVKEKPTIGNIEFSGNTNIKEEDLKKYEAWMRAMENAEKSYFELIELGATPQEARSVLPNSLKTEIVVTMNLRSWRNFFRLRCDSHAHPQMREVANIALTLFKEKLPVFFSDFE